MNPRPPVYETGALPLSYPGAQGTGILARREEQIKGRPRCAPQSGRWGACRAAETPTGGMEAIPPGDCIGGENSKDLDKAA